ncbi:MAG: zinc/iron-chelating domain-containing protein [Bdellovibrio sp. CG10_big_fil_rev_8_21_14_0_10_47_8]|nr:MAG: zinc/iron-chelating domain-containing protein [Bdellovibrio sp. CG10_big_fil_rev_8_21_14_0_10_47_8]
MSWWEKGVQFQCQGSGNCCTSHGEYGFVYMTKQDRQRMAKELGLSVREFTQKHCDRTDGFFHLKENPQDPNCRFLKNKRCSVYAGRPTQCRTWPFWPEVMNAKAWKKEIASFCPGVRGKKPLVPAEEIEVILKEQKMSEDSLDQEARKYLSR